MMPEQEVERESAAMCAELSMQMPMAVSLRGGDVTRVPGQLLAILRQPEAAVPLTPSLKAKPLCSTVPVTVYGCSTDDRDSSGSSSSSSSSSNTSALPFAALYTALQARKVYPLHA
jgi:hypothetical protein